jgi:predicted nuclease of predicted toxin-antitoxin system
MKVLLDQNVNARFASLLPDHDVVHAHKMGWERLSNGDLIAAAEESGFDAVITADKNLRYQQNLSGRRISILVLNSRFLTWPHISLLGPQVSTVLETLPQGAFVLITPL